ncbi:RidA family protein [Pseudomonas sp. RAC1]|uniref:RidA family protein n=1 Tax=Pseudomonas sp. RAC1 TaxID=3064900 RepID=UPI00271D45E1|nr:RidA family protein [Pseudomonas sp. RAC1]MDV9033030.1 RidA family protein [Pseudomonas sp. RAC1]
MSKQIISTSQAPAAIGPYSQAVLVNGTLYMSGQIALDPKTMQLVGGIEAQTRQAFSNLIAVLNAADMQTSDIVKVNIYLVDLGNFALVNEVMQELFSTPFPARAAIGVASLPRGALVEVEAVAVKGTCND